MVSIIIRFPEVGMTKQDQALTDYEIEKQQKMEEAEERKAKKIKLRQRRKTRHYFAGTEGHECE